MVRPNSPLASRCRLVLLSLVRLQTQSSQPLQSGRSFSSESNETQLSLLFVVSVRTSLLRRQTCPWRWAVTGNLRWNGRWLSLETVRCPSSLSSATECICSPVPLVSSVWWPINWFLCSSSPATSSSSPCCTTQKCKWFFCWLSLLNFCAVRLVMFLGTLIPNGTMSKVNCQQSIVTMVMFIRSFITSAPIRSIICSPKYLTIISVRLDLSRSFADEWSFVFRRSNRSFPQGLSRSRSHESGLDLDRFRSHVSNVHQTTRHYSRCADVHLQERFQITTRPISSMISSVFLCLLVVFNQKSI